MQNRIVQFCCGLVCAVVFVSFPLVASAQTSNVQPRITAAIDNASRFVIPHSVHPLAQPAFDVGRLDGSTRMERMMLILDGSPQQDHDLSVLLDSQQTPGTSDYHRWLTPDEFGQRFGPAPQDIQAVTTWLGQQGFRVEGVARSGRWIEFSGTSAQVETAFQTQMHRYQVNGEAHVANSTDISFPAALAPVVRGVASLHNFFTRPALVRGPIIQGSSSKSPAGPATNLTGGIKGIGPSDFAKIYDVPNSLLFPAPGTVLNGSGETIAIVARSDINAQDVSDFQQVFGVLPSTPDFIHDGADPGMPSIDDQFETTLDTEWSGAVAPGAAIDVVISESTLIADGVDLSSAYIVDNDLAPIMSVSYIGCEAAQVDFGDAAFQDALWQQAAAQGISVFAASGDTGAAGCEPNAPSPNGAQQGVAVNGVASTPFDTAVGGLEFNETGAGETPAPNPPTTNATFWNATNQSNYESALGYIPEMIWNDSCTGCATDGEDSLESGGGGVSALYATPSYQTLGVTGLVPTLNAFTLPSSSLHPRGIPDVALSASANHDGYELCFQASCEPIATPKFYLVGGTSASAPSFAGIMAIIDQKQGMAQGLANYVLYPLAAAETYSNCNSNSRTVPATATTCVFNDITVGTNGVPGNDMTNDPTANALGFPAGTGYDLASGLGSVDVGNLVAAWHGVTFQGSIVNVAPTTSINITHGHTVNLTVSVTKMPSGSGPTGNVSLIAQGGNLPNTVGVAGTALSGGSASLSVNNLPGGANYNLIASYPGDGTYAGATSAPITVTVAPEGSAVELIDALPTSNQLTDAALSTTYGSPIAFEALISGVSSDQSSSGDGQATGSVTFTDTLNNMTTNLATVAMNDFKQITVGGAEFFDCSGTQNCLVPGSHTINGAYSGDSSFQAGNSSAGGFSLSVMISPTPTAVTVSSPSAGSTVGPTTQVMLTATVATSSSGAAPNGTVTFFSGTTQLGSPVSVSGIAGNATFFGVGAFAGATASLTTALATGTDSITAKYNGDTGDTNYAASPASAAITVTVTGPTFTISANPTTIPVSAPGATGSTVLTFTAMNGFSSNGPVTITPTCLNLPPETTCGSGASITIPTNGSAMATVTFLTTAPSAVIPVSHDRHDVFGWRLTSGVLAFASLLCAALLLAGYRGERRRWGFALMFTVFALVAVSVGCGGGGGGGQQNPGTPVNNYQNVSVTVTINGVTQTISGLTIDVQ